MMKNLKRKAVYSLASALSGMAALVVIVTTSIVYINQPEVPEELLN
ncbi:cyclic lactone autoinducer peptide [Paenibacillus sp. S150]|nr:cyclic lactone autoinducer peptide [Paenibacillus sp. S150]MBW4085809.1 cyclic lactone autoinducer peptide [Paenibacillus sp. S150]